MGLGPGTDPCKFMDLLDLHGSKLPQIIWFGPRTYDWILQVGTKSLSIHRALLQGPRRLKTRWPGPCSLLAVILAWSEGALVGLGWLGWFDWFSLLGWVGLGWVGLGWVGLGWQVGMLPILKFPPLMPAVLTGVSHFWLFVFQWSAL